MAIQKETAKPRSLKYAAARIGVSLPTVYRLIEAGKLRSYHIGRAHRVSPESIADCVALLERENQERTTGVVGHLRVIRHDDTIVARAELRP